MESREAAPEDSFSNSPLWMDKEGQPNPTHPPSGKAWAGRQGRATLNLLSLPRAAPPSYAPPHSPGGNYGAEGFKHFRGRQALLRVQDQQLPDQADGVFRHPAVPAGEQGRARGTDGRTGPEPPEPERRATWGRQEDRGLLSLTLGWRTQQP